MLIKETYLQDINVIKVEEVTTCERYEQITAETDERIKASQRRQADALINADRFISKGV